VALRRRWRSTTWITGAAAATVLALGIAVRRARTGEGRRDPVSQPEAPKVTARPEPAAPRAVIAQPQSAAPAATGKLRLLTVPPDAEILVDGQRVGVGSVFDLKLALGPRRLEIRAAGYQTFDTTIVVRVGETLSLGRIALRTREGTGS
jgi:hypothetical protein